VEWTVQRESPGTSAALRQEWREHVAWLEPVICDASREVHELVVTKLDVLDGQDGTRVAAGEERDCRPVEGFPAAAITLARCRPVWRSLPG
jgi:adenylosuccinate synthase